MSHRLKKLLATLIIGWGLTLAVLWVLGATSTIFAATFTVTKLTDTNDGTCDVDCSLREAIIAANTNGEADTIILPAGTHTLTIIGEDENAANTGDLDITEALTITGVGPGLTIINANSLQDRVFELLTTTVVISNMTIQGGTITGTGAGIQTRYNANLTLINTVVTSNSVVSSPGWGGGIFAESGNLTIHGGEISNNSASSSGGGIYINGGVQVKLLDGAQISNNTAFFTGGGAYIYGGTFTQTNGIIAHNTATNRDGGGIFVDRTGRVMLAGGQISNNSAINGGGLAVGWGAVVTQAGASITQNSAVKGGGVYIYDVFEAKNAYFFQTGSTITNNTATDAGGGIFIDNGQAVLSGGQIISNSAINGGGVFVSGNGVLAQTSPHTITQNHATTNGGGLAVSSDNVTLGGGKITYNAATNGGGVSLAAGNLTLSGGQAINNTATNGGGVYVSTGNATLSGWQITNNNAANGGGIFNANGATSNLTNTTISQNSGSGFFVQGGTVQVLSSTLDTNDVGFHVAGASTNGSLMVYNTIISNNSTAGLVYSGTNSVNITLSGAQGKANIFRNNGGGTTNINVTAPKANPNINALYNDWGVTGLANIENTINHKFDAPTLDLVEYYQIIVSADPATISPNITRPITITAVLTGLLNPIAGEVISFTASSGSLSDPSATTNAQHQAVVTYTSNLTTGTAAITATTNVDTNWDYPATTTISILEGVYLPIVLKNS